MKKNEIVTYESIFFGDVRTMIIDSEPWFAGIDIAEALGYVNPGKAVRDICRPMGSESDPMGTPKKKIVRRKIPVQTGIKADGTPAMRDTYVKFIDEGNMYRLVMRSNLPWATEFQDWVCDEVIPSIRKHGKYEAHWAEVRTTGKVGRFGMTDAIKELGIDEQMNGWAYSNFTNLTYETALGMNAQELRASKGLGPNDNIRDNLEEWELIRVCAVERAITTLLALGHDYHEIKEQLKNYNPKLLDLK